MWMSLPAPRMSTFPTSFMNWADSHGVGYLAWTFNAWDCSKGPALITSEDGTPTAYGAVVRARQEGGAFRDLFDFCGRIDKRIVNRRVIEALVRGARHHKLPSDYVARLKATPTVA